MPDHSLPETAPQPFVPLPPAQATMLEWNPNPVLVIDREHRLRFANRASMDSSAIDRSALIGQTVWCCYPAWRDSIFHEAYEVVLATDTAARFERHDETSDRWQSVYAYPADGGVVAIFEDVTEQRRAERELQQSEAALARAQEVAGIGSFTVRRGAGIDLSTQAYRLLGFDKATDVVDRDRVRALLDADDIAQWRTVAQRTPVGENIAADFQVTRRDGSSVVLHVLAHVALDATGKPGDVFGTAQDVTDQRLAVDSLRRSEETLRLAQEAANIGSFDFDLSTGVMVRSDQLLRLLGMEATDTTHALVDARPRFDFVHPDDRAIAQASWEEAMRTDSTQRATVRVHRVDGTERVMTSSAMQVRDLNGKPLRVVGTLVDITDDMRREAERKDVEAQLQQAHTLESLGVLAGGIAHDFNNLLVGILGNASLALLDLAPTSDARPCITEIEVAAQRAAELTRQLLAYAGKGRYVVESTDASAIIGDMRSRIRLAISRDASLQMELMTAIPRIDVDVSQFRQVVMQLITNASESLNGAPGLISVRTGQQEVSPEYLTYCAPGSETTPGKFVFVEVHDDGTGMDEATRQRIFEPFFSTKFTGRGLGLAAALGIMRSHRGAIRVDSDMGSGTSVKLLFPISAQQPIVPAGTAALTDWQHEGQVLVVDDEDSVRTVACALLQRRGLRTMEAEDGAKALAVFSGDPSAYSLVLLDLTMPHMNGEETLRGLRLIRPDINVLLMSGYNEKDVTTQFSSHEYSGFLQKPFRVEDLYTAVARGLGLTNTVTQPDR